MPLRLCISCKERPTWDHESILNGLVVEEIDRISALSATNLVTLLGIAHEDVIGIVVAVDRQEDTTDAEASLLVDATLALLVAILDPHAVRDRPVV